MATRSTESDYWTGQYDAFSSLESGHNQQPSLVIQLIRLVKIWVRAKVQPGQHPCSAGPSSGSAGSAGQLCSRVYPPAQTGLICSKLQLMALDRKH